MGSNLLGGPFRAMSFVSHPADARDASGGSILAEKKERVMPAMSAGMNAKPWGVIGHLQGWRARRDRGGYFIPEDLYGQVGAR